jgi:hypothetical protein
LSRPGALLTKLEDFEKKYAATYYGALAVQKRKDMLGQMDEIVKEIDAVLASGDVYMASEKLRGSLRAYGTNELYAEKTSPLTAAMRTTENRKLISVGREYFSLLKKKPGKSKKKAEAAFIKRYGDTFYGKLLKK